MNVCRIEAMRHPDALFEHDAIDTTELIREDGKAFFESKSFKVTETGRIQRPIPVLVGTQVVFALIKYDFFVNFS